MQLFERVIKKKTEKLMNKYFYFKTVWKLQLNDDQGQGILDITSSGNRGFPCEKIGDFNSFYITPEKKIFLERVDFIRNLNKKSSKYIYKVLKLINLSDLNDLYIITTLILCAKKCKWITIYASNLWFQSKTLQFGSLSKQMYRKTKI